MTFTLEQIKDALQECVGWDIYPFHDEDGLAYVLYDSYGDRYGDPFYELDDVVDLISNNEQVDEYLNQFEVLS